MSASPHLVHGMGMALEQPIWPAITEDETQAILRLFPGVGALQRLVWHSPRPFSAACLLETSSGSYLLKRHHFALRTPQSLADEHGFIRHLRRAGLPVPDIQCAKDGRSAVVQGSSCYELHRKSEGHDLYRDAPSWTPYQSHHHAFEAGIALAQLHHAARGYAAPERGGYPLISSLSILSAPDPLDAAAHYIGSRPAISAYLADKNWRQELARMFAKFAGGLSERIRKEAALWTHNDWHPSNLLWSEDGRVMTIFDFGLSTQTCALHDIAIAIERCAIPWLDMNAQAPDPDAAAALLAGYNTVQALNPDSLALILRLLPLVHIELALSEIDYFCGLLHDPAQADIAWYDFLIGHSDWFASAQGEGFLADVETATLERLKP